MTEAWVPFALYPDSASAEAVAGLLRSESVPARIAADEPIPGLINGFRVMVPSHLLHRAKAAMAQVQLTDEELATLAMNSRSEGEAP